MSTASVHPDATHHLPPFITAPGETDVLMVVMAVFLILVVLMVGVLFFRLHSLPEQIAHSRHKLQLEIVAVLGLISLFTHMHIFWIAGLLVALIDFPDFSGLLGRIAGSVERMAGGKAGEAAPHVAHETIATVPPGESTAAVPHEAHSELRRGDAAAAKKPELASVGTRS
jgi:hypothetical protein